MPVDGVKSSSFLISNHQEYQRDNIRNATSKVLNFYVIKKHISLRLFLDCKTATWLQREIRN